MNGILILNKPAGYTSMDCCAIIRKISGERKIGHTGTLDPNATGVLPVCIGKATRLIEYMDVGYKTYQCTFQLGRVSDTEDIWGNITVCSDNFPGQTQLESVIDSFKGDILQIPPMYSAKKINGVRLYDLAREGAVVERKPVKVHISSIDITGFDCNKGNGVLKIECSRGTYIRTVCADIGKKLGCGCIMTSLVRLKASGFSIDEAVSLDDVKSIGIEKFIKPVEYGVRTLNRENLTIENFRLVMHGNPSATINNSGISAAFYNDKLAAITVDGKIRKVFNDNF